MKKNVYKILVKTIYGDCFNKKYRILNAVPNTEYDDWDVIEAITLIKGYNNFFGEDVAKGLYELKSMNLIKRIQFGRESSPVIYFCLVNDNKKNRMIVEGMLKELKADEIMNDKWNKDKVRAWWD